MFLLYSHFKYDKLKASVADHLDHLHYLNDILLLKINVLNMILTDHMINRLLIPLYVYSLPSKEDLGDNDPERVHISKLVALFLLAQVCIITAFVGNKKLNLKKKDGIDLKNCLPTTLFGTFVGTYSI